jgi:hypothetical protein
MNVRDASYTGIKVSNNVADKWTKGNKFLEQLVHFHWMHVSIVIVVIIIIIITTTIALLLSLSLFPWRWGMAALA